MPPPEELRITKTLYCTHPDCMSDRRVYLCRIVMKNAQARVGWRCSGHWAACFVPKKTVKAWMQDHGYNYDHLPFVFNNQDINHYESEDIRRIQ